MRLFEPKCVKNSGTAVKYKALTLLTEAFTAVYVMKLWVTHDVICRKVFTVKICYLTKVTSQSTTTVFLIVGHVTNS